MTTVPNQFPVKPSSRTVLEYLAPRLSDFGELCVAGGAVRDQIMGRCPKDFDVFLLPGRDYAFELLKPKVILALSGLTELPVLAEWHKSEPYLVSSLNLNGTNVQVMLNPADDLNALLDTFDWNVCLFAESLSKKLARTSVDDIAPGKWLVLQKSTFPLSTLRRGFRFSERFLMKLRKQDLSMLFEQIQSRWKAHNEIGPTGAEADMPALAAAYSPA